MIVYIASRITDDGDITLGVFSTLEGAQQMCELYELVHCRGCTYTVEAFAVDAAEIKGEDTSIGIRSFWIYDWRNDELAWRQVDTTDWAMA